MTYKINYFKQSPRGWELVTEVLSRNIKQTTARLRNDTQVRCVEVMRLR